MILTFTDRAETDLTEIGDWIARDDPQRALSFVEELTAVCQRLLDYPHAFAAVEGVPGVRKRSYRGYIILFEVFPAEVRITSIRNGRRSANT